ncbi:MAG: glutamine--fructose-6-phosphate transaminase (isomerizing), partial [Pseudomonadota bacterium]
MCGIVGVLGQLEAAPRILDALRRLEYRGYDSAGISVVQNGVPVRRRAAGKLAELVRVVAHEPAHGTLGIGHTRWATHGAPVVENAHPHAAGPVHVVHNGIIENFRELRAALEADGIHCQTATDTEVIAQCVAQRMAQGEAPLAAVSHTLERLEGAFALAFVFAQEPDLIIAARHGSPLAIGWGEGEMFVGSDAIALSPMTGRITYLEEGDRAVLTRQGAEIYDAEGARVMREIRTVSVESAMVDRGRHRHFMAKEIHEQPVVLAAVLAHYLDGERARVVSPAEAVDWAGMSRLFILACGTGAYAAMVAKYWFEQLAGLPVEVDIASEFRYREAPVMGTEGALFVSQSGETADTLAALRHLKGRVATCLGVVNVAESAIARESDIVLPTLAGPEIGVASTKAFTCQLGVLALTAIAASRARWRIIAAREAELIAALVELPRLTAEALTLEPRITQLANEIAGARDVLYFGRGAMYPLALEGA